MPLSTASSSSARRSSKRKRSDVEPLDLIENVDVNQFLRPIVEIPSFKDIDPRPVKKTKTLSTTVSLPILPPAPRPLKDGTALMLDLKAAFRRSTAPKHLLGRDEEKLCIDKFLRGRLQIKKGGSLYISGCPGAGKTAVVEEIVAAAVVGHVRELTVGFGEGFRIVVVKIQVKSVNCTTLGIKKELEAFSPKELTILILDEIDQLEQLLLYRLFEQALLPTSFLILLGISNSLDLVDRTLPRLRAKHLEPELLHFAPYGVEAIKAIIKDRLASIEFSRYAVAPEQQAWTANTVFEPASLELCARKLASSGDVRKVLDTCRKALEISGSLPVKMGHILQVVSATSGSSSTVVNKINGVALQAKVVLCAALSAPPKNPTVHKLYEVYCTLSKAAISPVSRTEFLELIAALETPGLLTVKENKKSKEKEWKLLVSPDDICFALQGTPIVNGLLPKPKAVTLAEGK